MGALHNENKGGFKYALIGDYRPQETGGRITLRGTSYKTELGSILFFWSVLSWKQRQKLKRLTVSDQINCGLTLRIYKNFNMITYGPTFEFLQLEPKLLTRHGCPLGLRNLNHLKSKQPPCADCTV